MSSNTGYGGASAHLSARAAGTGVLQTRDATAALILALIAGHERLASDSGSGSFSASSNHAMLRMTMKRLRTEYLRQYKSNNYGNGVVLEHRKSVAGIWNQA
jgi:hypothetical protein